MIEITIDASGELTAGQQLVSPAVYLDHWALRGVSEDTDLSAQFTKVLETRGGTLLLSWANIAEFPDLDEHAARKAEMFIEAQLPRLFFLELNPFEVIQRENALLAGGPPVPPHADLDLAAGCGLTAVRSKAHHLHGHACEGERRSSGIQRTYEGRLR